MKFIISQVILIVVIISSFQCRRELRRERLSNLIYKMEMKKSELREGSRDAELFKSLDSNCVKNFLSNQQSDKMFINRYEEMIFMVNSLLKCSDDDITFKFFLDEFARNRMQKLTKCFGWKLQQLEPESPLIENININEEEIEECKTKLPSEEYEYAQKEFEKILGPLDVFSCEAVTGADDLLKFVGKGLLIKFGNSTEELRSTEMEKLKEWLKDVTFRTTDCMIKRFEKDMEARHANQTLNYFYQQAIVPIAPIPNSYFPESINIRNKIINSIDLDCTKKQLNLSKNGAIVLLQVEANILIGSAMSKCIKTDKVSIMNLLFDYEISEYGTSEMYLFCSKSRLQKLEPDSKLIKNFINTHAKEDNCEYYPKPEFDPFLDNFETYKESVGGDLKDTTCGALTDDLADIITYKALLIYAENDEELKRNESELLFDALKDTLQQFADCVLQRLK